MSPFIALGSRRAKVLYSFDKLRFINKLERIHKLYLINKNLQFKTLKISKF